LLEDLQNIQPRLYAFISDQQKVWLISHSIIFFIILDQTICKKIIKFNHKKNTKN
jgi:hypothetical protein